MTNRITKDPKYRVYVHLGKGFEIWLHSYFLCGLIELHKEGRILLQCSSGETYRTLDGIQSGGYPLFALICEELEDNRSKTVCFDPLDKSYVWQENALEACDVYFKRSYNSTHAGKLIWKNKIVPLNPMFATWAGGQFDWSFKVAYNILRNGFKYSTPGEGLLKKLLAGVFRLRTFHSLSCINKYENIPNSGKKDTVLFQTRLWDPATEQGDWVESCNEERVTLVRALKAGLGDRFVGGLSYTPYAQKYFPELLSNLTPTSKCKRPKFISLCRQFLVRVNIRALFDATPYSFGESLAANNVIVSHPLKNQFEQALVPDQHYLAFSRPEESIEACEKILSQPDLAHDIRKSSWDYYKNCVKPKAAILRYLNHAMEMNQ